METKMRILSLSLVLLMLSVFSVYAQKPTDYYNQGVELLNKRDFDAAIDCFNKAIEHKRDYVQAYYSRGVAKRRKGDIDGAIEDFTQMILIEPRYPEAYFARGSARDAKGNHERALSDYSLAIGINPKYAAPVLQPSADLANQRRAWTKRLPIVRRPSNSILPLQTHT